MSKLSEVWRRVPLLLRRRDLDRELEQEIRIHLEMETEENIQAGMQPEEARQAARRAFGNVALVKENTREVWGFPALESFWQDIRYGARQLGRSPGFTTVAVLSLALVIGANSTIFSVLNPILFHSFPFEEPNRVVVIREVKVSEPDRERDPTLSTFFEWGSQTQSFEQMALVTLYPQHVTLFARGQAEPGFFSRVSPTFFPLLGVVPQLGRTFASDDPSREAGEPVLLSNSYWRRRFGADPNVLGEQMLVAGQINSIVGVLPPGFRFQISFSSREADVWQSTPLPHPKVDPRSRGFTVLARLKPDIAAEQARLELEAIGRHLEEQDPTADENWKTDVQLLSDVFFAGWKESLFLLFGIALLVLLIGCANVANLLLARARRRDKEISIRVAMGANRLRLIRQLLTESVLLASLGGILGLVLTLWGIGLFVALAPEWWSLSQDKAAIDVRVIAFTAIVSIMTGVVFGLAPALRSSRPNLYESLKEGGRRSVGSSGPRLRNLLVISEVSLTLVLLVGAGLMLRSFLNLQQNDPGYDPRNLLGVQIFLQGPEYWGPREKEGMRVESQVDRFWEELLRRAEALPGVQSAATEGISFGCGVQILGQNSPGKREIIRYCETISPDFFRTLGISVMKGRVFAEQDVEGSRWVAVVNQTMARQFFRDEDPLGKLVQLDLGGAGGAGFEVVAEPQAREIVGVVRDVRQMQSHAPSPVVYVPHRQHRSEFPSRASAGSLIRKALFMRVASRPLSLKPAVERVIAEIDPGQVASFFATQEQILSESIQYWRFWMRLFLLFAVVALILVVVGVFGVIASAVSERTHEIGIRRALGAQKRDVFALIIKQALTVTLMGVVIGIAISLVLSSSISSLLYEVSRTDPFTYVLATLLLIGVALLACYFPARWAIRVDPVRALKHE